MADYEPCDRLLQNAYWTSVTQFGLGKILVTPAFAYLWTVTKTSFTIAEFLNYSDKLMHPFSKAPKVNDIQAFVRSLKV